MTRRHVLAVLDLVREGEVSEGARVLAEIARDALQECEETHSVGQELLHECEQLRQRCAALEARNGEQAAQLRRLESLPDDDLHRFVEHLRVILGMPEVSRLDVLLQRAEQLLLVAEEEA